MVEKHWFLCYNKPIKKEIKKLMELRHYLFDIKANLEANGWEYDTTVDDNVMDRKNGKVFTIIYKLDKSIGGHIWQKA